MWKEELYQLLGSKKMIVKEEDVERLSKDFYWFSPVLVEELKDKKADCAVVPETIDELSEIVKIAVKHRVPITPRGAGTVNYGQAVPLNGGIIIDLTGMNKILAVGQNDVAVQAGVRLGKLEKTLRKNDRELHIYPSTFLSSTVGGFLCGGSGGIGSIRWGNLWDGNVLSVTVMTVEENPQLLILNGDEVFDYIHNYGTTGILVEAVLPIEPKTEWTQHIVFFESFTDAVNFGKELASQERIVKRLLSVCEWPIPSHFQSLKKIVREGKSMVMLEVAEAFESELQGIADSYHGDVGFSIPAEKYQKGLKVSDYTWNHATLWAQKHGENMTYLQARFDTDRVFEQMDALRVKFGLEIQFHFEFIKINGKVTPASLPVILYKSKERLYEIIDYCESIGVTINDPHTYLLGFGGYNLRMESITKKKKINDPYDLLNKGKIPTAKTADIPSV